MDEKNVADFEWVLGGRAPLAKEIHFHIHSGLESQVSNTQAEDENLGYVAVGHKQPFANDEAGSSVRNRRVIGKLNSSDGGNCGLDVFSKFGSVQMTPGSRGPSKTAVNYVKNRATGGKDNRFGDVGFVTVKSFTPAEFSGGAGGKVAFLVVEAFGVSHPLQHLVPAGLGGLETLS